MSGLAKYFKDHSKPTASHASRDSSGSNGKVSGTRQTRITYETSLAQIGPRSSRNNQNNSEEECNSNGEYYLILDANGVKAQQKKFLIDYINHRYDTYNEDAANSAEDDGFYKNKDTVLHEQNIRFSSEEARKRASKQSRNSPGKTSKTAETEDDTSDSEYDDTNDAASQSIDTAWLTKSQKKKRAMSQANRKDKLSNRDQLQLTKKFFSLDKRVPSIAECRIKQRETKYLTHLDLCTNQLDLELCQTTFIGKLLPTKAALPIFGDNVELKTKHKVYGHPHLPQVHTELDAGPLAPVYDRFLHLEVCARYPYVIPIMKELRNSRCAIPRLLNIFIYDRLAEDFYNEVNERKSKENSPTLWLRLTNVTAESIYPYTRCGTDWFKRQRTSPYCLCFGLDSRAKVSSSSRTEVLRSFGMHTTIGAGWATLNGSVSGREMWVGSGNKINFGSNEYDELGTAFAAWRSSEGSDIQLVHRSPKRRSNLLKVEDMMLTNNRKHDVRRQSDGRSRANKEGATSVTDDTQQNVGEVVDDNQEFEDTPQALQRDTAALREDNETVVAEEVGVLAAADAVRTPATVIAAESELVSDRTNADTTGEVGDEATSNVEGINVLIGEAYHDGQFYSLLSNLPVIMEKHKPEASRPTVHVYAVVVGIGCPNRTKLGEWCISVQVIDTSISDESGDIHAVTLNIFCQNKSDIPPLIYAGDVLQMHRVVLQMYNGAVQMLGLKKSSFVVYRKKDGTTDSDTEWQITCTTSLPKPVVSSRNVSSSEDLIMRKLWYWGQHRIVNYRTVKQNQSIFIKDLIRYDELQGVDNSAIPSGDLTALVAAVISAPADWSNVNQPKGFLRIWDGTGQSIADEWPTNVVPACDPPTEVVKKVAALARKLSDLSPDKSLKIPEKLCGHVVNAVIWEDSQWEFVHSHVRIGSTLRLRNVRQYETLLPDKCIFCVSVTTKSSLTLLYDKTYEVTQMIEQHDSRLCNNHPFIRSCALLPYESNGSVSATSIVENMDISSHSARNSNQTIATFLTEPVGSFIRLPVYLEKLVPSLDQIKDSGLEDVIRRSSESSETETKFVFYASVTLRDTANNRLDVVLLEDGQAGRFIFGNSPDLALQNPERTFMRLAQLFPQSPEGGEENCSLTMYMAEMFSVDYVGEKYFVLSQLNEHNVNI